MMVKTQEVRGKEGAGGQLGGGTREHRGWFCRAGGRRDPAAPAVCGLLHLVSEAGGQAQKAHSKRCSLQIVLHVQHWKETLLISSKYEN